MTQGYGPFTAYSQQHLQTGAFGSWTYIIQLPETLQAGDRISIGYDLRGGLFYDDFPQNTDPAKKNFFSFQTDSKATLIAEGRAVQHYVHSAPSWQEGTVSETYLWRDLLKALSSLNLHMISLTVEQDRIEPGETIVILVGDKSGGCPGQILPQQATDFWRHWAVIHPAGEKTPRVLGSDYLTISAGPADSLATVIPSQAREGGAINIRSIARDRFGNPVATPKVNITGDASVIGSGLIQFEDSGIKRIEGACATDESSIQSVSNPCRVSDDPYKIYWGDIHGHTVMSDGGARTPNEYFQWARDNTLLDFAALTDHDFGIAMHDADKNWRVILEANRRFNQAGRFVTIPAWEISHLGLGTDVRQGHRNIYFLDDNPPFYNSSPYGRDRVQMQYQHFEQLVELLERDGLRFLVADHTSHKLTRWELFRCEQQRLVELHSCFGSSEWTDNPNSVLDPPEDRTSRAALEHGYRFGFTAGTDTHMGAPAGPREKNTGFTHVGADVLPGMVAVLATELTREAVFDALWHRRTYAVRGSRIYLDVRLNDHRMGEEFSTKPGKPRVLQACIGGTAPIEHVSLIHNGKTLHQWEGSERMDLELEFIHNPGESESKRNADYYYLRVLQHNAHMAWSSPIWALNK
jgi:hypothetical protein